MRHPIVSGGKIAGFVVGNITYTIERNSWNKKTRIFGSISEFWVHSDFSAIYENVGEPDSIFDIHLLKDDGSENQRLEKLILNQPSVLRYGETMGSHSEH